MPATELRRRLRAAGHALMPVVHIGKQGGTDAVLGQVMRALLDHELVKVKLGSECPETRFELAETFASLPRVHVAQILGRTILLYKRHPKKPRFEKAEAVGDAQASPRNRPAALADPPKHRGR
ncbi:MAG: YhbY family RNA-binding protein [Deltaproteobacteria bacterium]|nr:YhbY family RNA-binding protein [Deltaproteobacteria bacterium]